MRPGVTMTNWITSPRCDTLASVPETAFSPFDLDSEMIGPPEHTWMINFRVDDLDAIVEQLRSAGETVDVDPERYPNGRFAEVRDPEGNGIQLWQPMGPE